jgi:hypothetical protein
LLDADPPLPAHRLGDLFLPQPRPGRPNAPPQNRHIPSLYSVRIHNMVFNLMEIKGFS